MYKLFYWVVMAIEDYEWHLIVKSMAAKVLLSLVANPNRYRFNEFSDCTTEKSNLSPGVPEVFQSLLQEILPIFFPGVPSGIFGRCSWDFYQSSPQEFFRGFPDMLPENFSAYLPEIYPKVPSAISLSGFQATTQDKLQRILMFQLPRIHVFVVRRFHRKQSPQTPFKILTNYQW